MNHRIFRTNNPSVFFFFSSVLQTLINSKLVKCLTSQELLLHSLNCLCVKIMSVRVCEVFDKNDEALDSGKALHKVLAFYCSLHVKFNLDSSVLIKSHNEF